MKNKLLFVCGISIFLPGCVVGPKKCALPSHPMQSFTNQHNQQPVVDLWWHQFNDQQLNALIEQSMHSNYDILLALEKIEEARAVFALKTGDMFPEIGALALAAKTKFGDDNPLNRITGGRSPSFFLLGFDALWEVDIWGKLRRLREAAGYDMLAAIETARDVHIMIIAEVARAYIHLQSSQINKELLEQIIKIDQELLTVIQDKKNAGLENQLVYETQKQQLTVSEAALAAIIVQVEQAKNMLTFLLGKVPHEVSFSPVKEVPTIAQLPQTGIPSDLLRRRPDIKSAEKKAAAALELTGAAVAEWFPSFKLFGLIGTGSIHASRFFEGGTLSWLIFPSVQWPIINFGRIKANVHAKESAHRQAVLTYSKTVIEAFKEVEDFLIAYYQARNEVNIARNRLQSLQTSTQLTESLYQSGLESRIEYLNSVKEVILGKILITNAQEVESTQLIGLYKALGGGWHV